MDSLLLQRYSFPPVLCETEMISSAWVPFTPWDQDDPMNQILLGSIASLLAVLATGLGALLIFFIRRVSDAFLDASLGFAAGVMLAATFFSLLVPALERGGIWQTVAGIILGTLFLVYAERLIPHMHEVARIQLTNTDCAPYLWTY